MEVTKLVAIKDFGTHQYKQEVEKTELFCVNCGKQTVWGTTDGGDYYVGDTYFCISCDHAFTNPSIDNEYPQDQQVIKQIKQALGEKK